MANTAQIHAYLPLVLALADMLESGLHHQAMTRRFENIDEVEERDSASYRAALRWRGILRDTILQVLEEHDLHAIVYPTIVQRPKHVGERQPGSNCALSAQSGLPAISVPAGFTTDGLPVGLELLGRPFDDVTLVALAFAFEQGTKHRVLPSVTPLLVNGKAPVPVSFSVSVSADGYDGGAASTVRSATFTLDPTSNRLEYTLTISEDASADVLAVTLHAGDEGQGPVVARLTGIGARQRAGALELHPADRAALDGGEIYLRAFTRQDPLGRSQGRLVLPR
ncbi:MAG TPA: amidase family protein [Acidobacteriota bacterium]|nr:amidase family protein [Acidobacteriota bacterium]